MRALVQFGRAHIVFFYPPLSLGGGRLYLPPPFIPFASLFPRQLQLRRSLVFHGGPPSFDNMCCTLPPHNNMHGTARPIAIAPPALCPARTSYSPPLTPVAQQLARHGVFCTWWLCAGGALCPSFAPCLALLPRFTQCKALCRALCGPVASGHSLAASVPAALPCLFPLQDNMQSKGPPPMRPPLTIPLHVIAVPSLPFSLCTAVCEARARIRNG